MGQVISMARARERRREDQIRTAGVLRSYLDPERWQEHLERQRCFYNPDTGAVEPVEGMYADELAFEPLPPGEPMASIVPWINESASGISQLGYPDGFIGYAVWDRQVGCVARFRFLGTGSDVCEQHHKTMDRIVADLNAGGDRREAVIDRAAWSRR